MNPNLINLKKIYTNTTEDKGLQNVYTPVEELVEYSETLKDFLDLDKFTGTTIAIVYNVEWFHYFVCHFTELNRFKFTFFYDSEFDKKIFSRLALFMKVTNVDYIKINNTEPFFNTDMKFDKIIMNPPYGVNRLGESNYLHYYITENALNFLSDTGSCISLMPISIISSTSTKKEFMSLKERFSKRLISVEEFDSNIFSGTSMKEVCIYKLDNKEHSNFTVKCKKCNGVFSNLNSLNYGITQEENTILEKIGRFNSIRNRMNGFYVSKKHRNEWNEIVEKFFVNSKIIDKDLFICFNCANGGMDATWQSKKLNEIGILNKENLKDLLSKDKCLKYIVGFKNSEKTQIESIVNFANLKAMRFVLSKKQVDQNIHSKCYDYFPDIDFSKIKTDEDFYNFFNITEEEQKIIEEKMEKYK